MNHHTSSITDKDSIAVSKRSTYKYELRQSDPTDPPVTIKVSEYIDLRTIKPPKYDVFINEYHIKCEQRREDIPARFLHIIDMIDHYIYSYLKRHEKYTNENT